MRMRWGLLHGIALVAAVACQGGTFFVCEADDQCGAEGTCQPTGSCSFPDDQCPSGQRYGDSSPGTLAGECVPVGEGSGDEGGSTTEGDSGPSVVDSTGGGGGCPADWWDCAWAHRQRLDLARPVVSPLADVPVLVLLTAGRVDHERMQADGEDVRFVSASGAVLPYEFEHWEPTGVSAIWVGVDQLGAEFDHLWLYYSNPVAESAEDPAGVWPDPHVGVWHLGGLELTDSSGNEHHATSNGTIAPAPGQIAEARDFVSNNPRLDVEPTPALADVFATGGTVSAWIRPRSWGGNDFGRIAHKSMSAEAGWMFYVGAIGRLYFSMQFGVGIDAVWSTPDEVIQPEQWAHVAVTYDPQGLEPPRIFVDGLEQELEEPPMTPEVEEISSDAEAPLHLGNRPDNNRSFDGFLDEIRISRVARDPAWMSVQYDSMRDALFTYGPIESSEGAP